MPAPDYAEEIERLEKAVASGELTIEQDGERVTYRSMADLVTALNYFQAKAGQAQRPTGDQGVFGFSTPIYTRD